LSGRAETVTVLDVGHGSCVVISTPGELALIDTGAGTTILEHIRALEFQSIQKVLISHSDRDHVGGLVGLLADPRFTIEEIWLNSDAFKGSSLWTALNYELDAQDRAGLVTVQSAVREGQSFTLGKFSVDVLAPRLRVVGLGAGSRDRDNRRLESNSLSVVARVSFCGAPLVVVPGDIDEVGLDHLMDQEPAPDLRAPFLVFPHHGGNVSRAGNRDANAKFANRIVDLVQPNTVVFSIGRGEHGTPRREILGAVRSAIPSANVLCTQLSKNCAATLLDVAAPITSSITARGSASGTRCAGSIQIYRDVESWQVDPTFRQHLDFIRVHASSPLCLASQKAEPAIAPTSSGDAS
jgi:beta-lactamase superfamily II metal-dependent hydrolase